MRTREGLSDARLRTQQLLTSENSFIEQKLAGTVRSSVWCDCAHSTPKPLDSRCLQEPV
jgi:hypothetical protein